MKEKLRSLKHIKKVRDLARRELLVGMAGLGLSLFSLGAVAASDRVVKGIEAAIFSFIYNWPVWLIPVFQNITFLGSFYMVLTASGLAAFTNKFRLASLVMAGSTLAYVIAIAAKSIIGRPRPIGILPDVIERELFTGGPGFPSGHTAVATVISLVLLPYLPRKLWFLVPLWIVLVAISRIYLGVHAPWDVVGGFGVGLMVIAAVYTFSPPKSGKLAKHRRPDA